MKIKIILIANRQLSTVNYFGIMVILLTLFMLQCIIRFVPSIENRALPDLKKSEEEVSIPQENLSNETQHIYCPSEDNADGITNTDHEWIYLN